MAVINLKNMGSTMINFVRVDDRLLHGQIICAWAPFYNAEMLVVASDNAASDELLKGILLSCASEGFGVEVVEVGAAAKMLLNGTYLDKRLILVVGNLEDALRLFDEGVHFRSLNLGNLHHEDGGRTLSASVTIDAEDESVLTKLVARGVSVEVRDVPTSQAIPYSPA